MSTWIDDVDVDSTESENEDVVVDDEGTAAAWDASDDEDEEAKKEEERKKKAEEEAERRRLAEEEARKKREEEEERRIKKAKKEAEKEEEIPDHLRSPICVIMGHVDTGKTKLLDKIRKSNIQTGEAGGITQQIGATYFPMDTLKRMTTFFADKFKLQYNNPGLLIIDTPGHESFSNLRSRGSSLCDIAILVIDIMHGIENQTKESISLLRAKNTPFIVALNKIDRLSQWKAAPGAEFIQTFRKQTQHTKDQFDKGLQRVITQMGELGLNATPYYRMKFGAKLDLEDVPIVPTSAISGEGIPDLLALVQLLTQMHMEKRLKSKKELQCTVLEVKVEQGIGMTLDVILVNGVLHVNDTIVIAGMNGPITTHIRALLTPEPLKELRVKSQWVHHDKIYAAMGCKIAAPDLNGAIAGSELFVAKTDDEIPELMDRVNADVSSITDNINKQEDGILVQASTLGSLEALLCFLKSKDLNVCAVGIGPLYRKDLLQIQNVAQRNPKYAVVLAFNVEISPEAKVFANENDITIFQAEIIYHLTDMYDQYLKDLKTKEKEAARASAIFPVEIQYLEKQMIHRSKPIIIGVKVLDGTLKKGTPISTCGDNPRMLGTVESIQVNNQPIDEAKIGQECAICIKEPSSWSPEADKDFHPKDHFVSKLNRQAIDLLKQHFREDLTNDDWRLIVKIKSILKIQ
jgi:translation initiation factor 5B